MEFAVMMGRGKDGTMERWKEGKCAWQTPRSRSLLNGIMSPRFALHEECGIRIFLSD
jgi:hypothetical protein